MSNFSSYFPVPSSGGGGIPINGYFPFLVNTSTTGYDNATGLYTHPDGTFWLKTGFQINAAATVYPDAAGVIGYAYNNFTFATTRSSVGVATDGTNYYIVSDDNDTVRIYDSSLTFVSSFSVAGQIAAPQYITFDGTNLWVGSGSSANVGLYSYTTAGVYTGTSINLKTLLTGWNNFNGVTWNGSNLIAITTFTNEYVELSTAGTIVTGPNSFTTPSSANGLAWDGTYFHIVNPTTRTVVEYNTSFVATGNSFSVATQVPSQTVKGIGYDTTNQQLIIGSSGGDAVFGYTDGKIQGDPTARTDTDSAQPLFVRIK